MVDLPAEVQTVRKKNGKTYYYWAPGRGTRYAGPRHPIKGSPSDAAFWDEIRRLQGGAPTVPPGSIAALVTSYRDSQDFLTLADSTQATYDVHLRRFENPEAWGMLRARDLIPPAVLAGRDAMKETPVAANQMLSVGRTLWDWAIPLGYLGAHALNPFDKVKDLPTEDKGHVPWPLWCQDVVLSNAPEDLQRIIRLGIATCQRESDLIRLGPKQRERVGVWVRPKKTRRKRRAFLVPLSTTDAFMLDRWANEPIVFHNTRWKAPRPQHRDDLYIYTPRGAPYTTMALRSRWNRWLATAEGRKVCAKWKDYIAEQVRRYDWDIDPEDARAPTIHGLRGTGILLRLSAGYTVEQISNDVGMSRPMVDRYMRFRDQVEVAERNHRRFEIIDGSAG